MIPSGWLPAWAFVERDLRKYFRNPALLASSLLLPLLQLVVIGYGFGGKIRDVAVALVDLDRGPEALLLQEKLRAVEANARTFKVYVAESLDAALRDTREGRIAATIVIKGAFAGLVVMLVGVSLAGMFDELSLATLFVLFGFGILVASALVSLVSLMVVRVDDPMIPRVLFGLLNTLLFFPSGAVYPISSFPRWMQLVAKVDPFTYAVHGFRSLLLKGIGLSAVLGDVAVLSALTTVCMGGLLLAFRRHLGALPRGARGSGP